MEQIKSQAIRLLFSVWVTFGRDKTMPVLFLYFLQIIVEPPAFLGLTNQNNYDIF